jgi:hypothetical protein
MTATGAIDFDIATLRARRTNKRRKLPPNVLPDRPSIASSIG